MTSNHKTVISALPFVHLCWKWKCAGCLSARIIKSRRSIFVETFVSYNFTVQIKCLRPHVTVSWSVTCGYATLQLKCVYHQCFYLYLARCIKLLIDDKLCVHELTRLHETSSMLVEQSSCVYYRAIELFNTGTQSFSSTYPRISSRKALWPWQEEFIDCLVR